MIDLSIIVPLYNTEKYIARCLDSLLDQGFENDKYEIIVINDESVDNGKEVVEKYVSEHDNISLLSQNNQGLSATRNRGIKCAKGQYIYFIDSDDFLIPNMLSKITTYAKQNDIDVFGFGVKLTHSSRLPHIELSDEDLCNLTVLDGPSYISKYNYRNEAVWFISRRQFLLDEDLEFVEGVQMADTIFTPQLLYKAAKITSIPHKIYGYYQRQDSVLNTSDVKRNRTLFNAFIWSCKMQGEFYQKVKKENNIDAVGLRRIKNRQQFFVVFLLMKVVKSDISLKEINQLLNKLKHENLYPIKFLKSPDYNSFRYTVLPYVLNNKFIFLLSTAVFRFLNKILLFFKF